MEPLSMVATALLAGAAAGLSDTAAQAIKDAYASLKALITRKFSSAHNGEELTSAIRLAEKKPDDKSRQDVLKDELASAGAANDTEVIKTADALMQLVKAHAPSIATQYNVSVVGSGAAAAGQDATAVGAGGIIIKGNSSGNNNTGNQTTTNHYYGEPPDRQRDTTQGLVATPEGRRLQKLLDEYWNMEDIENLCFELGVDVDNLPGRTKAAIARSLVLYAEKNDRLDELRKLMRVQRPNLRDQLQ